MAVAALSLTASNLFPVDMSQVKEAPAELKAMLINQSISKLKASTKLVTPVTKASDLVGGYTWTYEQASTRHQDPDSVATTATGTVPAAIYDADDEAGTVKMAGLFDGAVEATLDLTSYSVPVLDVASQTAAYSSYGVCDVRGVFYYEGDANNAAGWYFTTPTFFVIDNQIIEASNVWIVRVIKEGQYANYSLTPYWKPGSIMDVNDASNAVMDYTYNDFSFTSVLQVTEDTENYVVSADNFAGMGTTPVTFTLAEDKTWVADPVVFYTSGDNNFAFYAIDGEDLVQETGTGTEKVLTFDKDWTGYDASTNYWLGQRGAATITLISDEEFVYPTTEPTPEKAYYLIGAFNEWNQEAMIPFEENDGVFTLTYTFGGEFKIKDEQGNWWGGNGVNLTEENPSMTLIDGSNLNLAQPAEYTLTIEDGVLTVTGFPEPQVVEYNDFFLCGTFNGWYTDDTLIEFTPNEDGTEFTCTAELEANAEFKVISHDLSGNWTWFGGSTNGDNFLITADLLGGNIDLVNGNNFQVVEGGSYDIKVKTATPAKGLQEPLVMIITKTPTAISTIGTDVKADNAYYNLMGVKFNGVPTAAGIYIHNGRKVVIK